MQPYCEQHYEPTLQRLVIEGVAAGIDGKGDCPAVKGWLNKFARLVAVSWDAPGGLTKAKIEQRGFDFATNGTAVLFSILRHPVGRETRTRWSIDPTTRESKLLEDVIVKTCFPLDEDGKLRCPDCGALLDVTPGRASCSECDYGALHEHSWSLFRF
jgi:hypothetical protein